jgi:hypothetical protein
LQSTEFIGGDRNIPQGELPGGQRLPDSSLGYASAMLGAVASSWNNSSLSANAKPQKTPASAEFARFSAPVARAKSAARLRADSSSPSTTKVRIGDDHGKIN